jgi:translation initiation factor IF-2
VEFIFVTPQLHQWILTFHVSEKHTSSILRLKGAKNGLITGRVVKQKKWVESAKEHGNGLDCSILLSNTVFGQEILKTHAIP